MHPAWTRRFVALALTAGSAVALTGCGAGGVMTSGSTAATLGSHTVTTSDVQQAVTDINTVDTQGGITGQQAAVLLVLEPEVSKIAGRYGATTTESEVEQEYANRLPEGKSLNPATVSVLKSNAQLNKLANGQNKKGAAQVMKLVQNADIDLNPRYGEFSEKGVRKAPTNWIDSAASKAQQ